MKNNIKNISCKSIKDIDSYYFIGMDKYFNYYRLEDLSRNNYMFDPDNYPGYDLFKFAYVKDDKIVKIEDDLVVYSTNRNKKCDLYLSYIKSYKGITLQIMGEELYDLYVVYEVINDECEFLLFSKDFVITSDKFKENHIYYVEAYNKRSDYYQIKDTSFEIRCVFREAIKSQPNLTICIPVYNGENYLPRTLDSAILSTYRKLKILIINDGSTDKTANVLRWYDKNYDFIKVINNKNNKISYTRNMLIDCVDTPYMAFLDADDLVSPNMYNKLMECITKTNSDVAICKAIIREDMKKDSPQLNVKCEDYKLYTYDQMTYSIENDFKNNIYFIALWNKVMKTSLAKKVRFPINNYYEDNAYTPAVYSYTNKYVFVPKVSYIWDKRKRITEGTYTTEYKKVGSDKTNLYYLEALEYAIYNSNKNNREYVIYDCIKLMLKNIDKLTQNGKLYKSCINKIKSLLSNIDLNNKFLKSNSKLYNKVMKILDEKV